ncbi:ABC transporter substrate-binding protein [Tenggerimyces flavus]|uniref:ABC transporter substrate-binding protein n=1 Tax=Tenggerimyces flavus TaxID=1708749 RepID=A0ABV7YN29_9ACTN|nr:extracellular solute-binding protein [Tenggerimyces flavus]MBM7786190.1 ABC-type glycerol-3-phosphate transport system substrate-binding protein [Tenggerimyces flavus]
MQIKGVATGFAAVLLGASLLAACTDEPKSPAATTVELLTWHGPESSTKYYEGYQKIAESYMETHEDVDIEIKYEADDTFGSILETGFAGNTAPDIVQMKSGQRTTFSANLLDLRKHLLQPNPYDKREPRWIDTFVGGEAAFPPEKNASSANGLLFVPNDGNPDVYAGKLYIFNKKLVADAGLDPNSPPKDWKEMFTWLEALKGKPEVAPIAGSKDVGGKVSQIGYGFGADYADRYFAPEFNTPEFADDLYNDKLYVLTCYTGGSQPALTDLPYYPAMFKLMKQHLSYYQTSWTENSPETEILTFASAKAALMNTTFWDYGTLVGSLSDSSFPDGYGLFQLPYFGKDTLPYAVGQGWVTQAEADAAAPFAVDRPAAAGGAGKHEYGFTVNAASAKDTKKLNAIVDFLRYLSSKDVQAKYVQTAQSMSPVKDVPLIDALTPFVVAEPPGGYAKHVLGYTVVEWGKAGWDVDLTRFLSGSMSSADMVKAVAAPEWAKDIPKLEALKEGVATAKADAQKAAADTKEEKGRALAFAQLRLKFYERYYYSLKGDLRVLG